MASPLPTADAFGGLVGSLIGKRVQPKAGAPLPAAKVGGVATYVDASGKVAFVAVADVAFLASAGAALAMIPVSMVNESVRAGKPAESLVENAYEVLNVAASLFNEVPGAGTHVKVQRLELGPLKPELAKRALKPIARLDLDVPIPGYVDGKVSLIALS